MRSGFLPARVVHVHPTRACNLACAHCYSESAPGLTEAIDVELLLEGLAALRTEGYEIVSVSGGEPLVYRGLDRLVSGAAALGYRVHLITNGLLLDANRLARLAPHVFLIGVSIDGSEEVHNAVRGRPNAYAKALKALQVLSEVEVPFGIIYAASARSLPDIPWAFELARELHADLLHIRPLAPEGRARAMASDWTLSREDCARLYFLAELLALHGEGSPRVQLDLVPLELLQSARPQFELLKEEPQVAKLSDAVNPLVIDPKGRLFPFTYGIDERLLLGTIWPSSPMRFSLEPEMQGVLTGLLDSAFREAGAEGMDYLDWFAHLTRVSRRVMATA
jgi:MoaA/NifB/PqqE/SkfB family radical SAM enzyme